MLDRCLAVTAVDTTPGLIDVETRSVLCVHETGEIEIVWHEEQLRVRSEQIDVVAAVLLAVRGDERPVRIADQVLEDVEQRRPVRHQPGIRDSLDFQYLAVRSLGKLFDRLDEISVILRVQVLHLAVGVNVTDAQQPDAVSLVGYHVEDPISQVFVEDAGAGRLLAGVAMRHELDLVDAVE